MKKNPYSGLFIAIEGLDGSGLSTQVKLLEENFRKKNIPAFTTKEPTDNIIGGLIRGSLSGVYRLPPSALQLLFVADRLHHLQRQIIPTLKTGKAVITDRFLWSTVAFGGVNMDRDWLLDLHRDCFLPNLTILLEVKPKICLKRLGIDRLQLELFEKEKTLKKVWENYLWLVRKFPDSIKIINGEQPIAKISRQVWRIVSNII